MSSPVFDQPHLADIGAEYEYFVGAYFEIIHGCYVIYQGHMLGEEDGGVDLIAVNASKTYLIQCKNRYRSLIHENTVNQLGGAARSFLQRFPEARCVTPVVFTTTDFDAPAQFAAEANNVQLRRMAYEKKTVDDRLVLFNDYLSTESHHSPTYNLPAPADFNAFVRQALARCAPGPESRPESKPEQTVSKSESFEPIPEQIVQKPEQIVQKPEQTTRQKRSKAIRTCSIILLLELCDVFVIFAYLVPIAAFFAAVFLFEYLTQIRMFETVPFLGFMLAGLASISGIALKNLCQERLERKIKQKKSELP